MKLVFGILVAFAIAGIFVLWHRNALFPATRANSKTARHSNARRVSEKPAAASEFFSSSGSEAGHRLQPLTVASAQMKRLNRLADMLATSDNIAKLTALNQEEACAQLMAFGLRRVMIVRKEATSDTTLETAFRSERLAKKAAKGGDKKRAQEQEQEQKSRVSAGGSHTNPHASTGAHPKDLATVHETGAPLHVSLYCKAEVEPQLGRAVRVVQSTVNSHTYKYIVELRV